MKQYLIRIWFGDSLIKDLKWESDDEKDCAQNEQLTQHLEHIEKEWGGLLELILTKKNQIEQTVLLT